MSLLDEMKTACIMLDKRSVPDGLGGFKPKWDEGATFDATIIKDQSIEARVAEKNGLKSVFTVVVQRGVPLEYHDVFRRLSDGAVFRVTSDITDSEAPSRSTVKIGKVTAESWELTT